MNSFHCQRANFDPTPTSTTKKVDVWYTFTWLHISTASARDTGKYVLVHNETKSVW